MWIYSTSSTTYGIRNSSDCQRDMDGCPGRAKVSNELSNYCGGNGQPRLDDPGSIGAPGIYIDAHLSQTTADDGERDVVRLIETPCLRLVMRRSGVRFPKA